MEAILDYVVLSLSWKFFGLPIWQIILSEIIVVGLWLITITIIDEIKWRKAVKKGFWLGNKIYEDLENGDLRY